MARRLSSAAAADKGQLRIRDVQTMVIPGDRIYLLVKVIADDGTGNP